MQALFFGYISNSPESSLMESRVAMGRHIWKSKTSLQIKTEQSYLQIEDNEEFQATIHRGVKVPVPLFIRGRRIVHLKSTTNSKCRETFESIKFQGNLSQYYSTSRHSTEKKFFSRETFNNSDRYKSRKIFIQINNQNLEGIFIEIFWKLKNTGRAESLNSNLGLNYSNAWGREGIYSDWRW